jgi:hypothetical protein
MSDRRNYPLWVKLGLWGLPTRASALAFLWGSVVLTVLGLIGGFWNPSLFIIGLLLPFAAWWYGAAINWVDKNGKW